MSVSLLLFVSFPMYSENVTIPFPVKANIPKSNGKNHLHSKPFTGRKKTMKNPRTAMIVSRLNKSDLKKSNLKRIESAFPQYTTVGISAKKGENMENFYKELFRIVK